MAKFMLGIFFISNSTGTILAPTKDLQYTLILKNDKNTTYIKPFVGLEKRC